MAVTKILAIGGKYGHVDNASYTNNGRLYVGKNPDTGNIYRSRVTFPSIRTIAEIGDANIIITKVTLTMRRDSGSKAATVNAGSSADSSWGAVCDGITSMSIPNQTAWYTFDITNCAEAILNYSGNWHVHLTGTGTYLRFNGIEEGATPYISVTWEYAASTITTGTDYTELGTTANFTITPEENYHSYNLSYEFGSQSGSITSGTTATNYSWNPPLSFASEIPNSSSSEAKITMRVFNSEGTQIRTEILYVTLKVPESLRVKIVSPTYTNYLINSLYDSVALAGRSYLMITPTVDTNNSYGATIKSFNTVIEIKDSNKENILDIETLTWNTFVLEDVLVNPQLYYTATPLKTKVFSSSGVAIITYTAIDSRGFEDVITTEYTIIGYRNPEIQDFKIERYETIQNPETGATSDYIASDLGENVRVSFIATCADPDLPDGLKNMISWTIEAYHSNGDYAYYEGTNQENNAFVQYTEDRTIITETIPLNVGVEYTLTVQDSTGYSSSQFYSVSPGRTNFALAGSKYGASFGCLPKGTEENPMLESAYPIYAYGGIEGVTNYTEGEVNTGGTWVDGKPIYRKVIIASGNFATNAIISANSFSEAETVISLKGIIIRSDNVIMPIPIYSGTEYFVSYEIDASKNLKLYKGTSITTAKLIAIAEYTKTTN